MNDSSAERIVGSGGRQYHIGLAPGEVASYVLLFGDPARAERFARRFQSIRVQRRSREYLSFTGLCEGGELTVMATGMGCDNTEMAVVELLQCERKPTLIRVGSSGGLQESTEIGDLVISSGALRLESTSLGFVEAGYPALAHHEVVLALLSAVLDLGHRHHLGVTATAAGFYGWQGRRGLLLEPRDPELPERLRKQGVLNFEMETSTLLTLATLASVRAGAVCAVFANRPKNTFIASEDKEAAEERAVEVALRAVAYLRIMDGRAGGSGFRLKLKGGQLSF